VRAEAEGQKNINVPMDTGKWGMSDALAAALALLDTRLRMIQFVLSLVKRRKVRIRDVLPAMMHQFTKYCFN
jgi:predicted alternative tryptophan synthase beta-subunit